MMEPILLLLTETKNPRDLTFNDCGVCQKVLCAKGETKFGSRKFSWQIHIISINGIWYGSSHCDYNLGGYGGPVTKTRPFKTEEECVGHYYRQIEDYIRSTGCHVAIPMPTTEQFKECEPYNYENFV